MHKQIKLVFGFYIGIFLLLSCGKKINFPVLIQPKNETAGIVLEEKPIVELGSFRINTDQFKSQIKMMPGLDSLNSEEILENYIERKRLSLEAISLGLDTADLFQEELDTYRKIYLQEQINDKEDVKKLGDEAYNFYKYELNASQIFLPLSAFAKASDTLKLYNQLISIRTNALKNKNFDYLAKEWSKDQKTKEKSGLLGWFSVFNLIYPLEKVAFKLSKDSISMPVRTKAGYHLLKLNDKRNNSGLIQVKHILRYVNPEKGNLAYEKELNLLDSLKKTIKTDEDFNVAVLKYSDDYNSRNQEGKLPSFGIGTREEAIFEELAFNLKVGEISYPVRSSVGIHLIKVISKKAPFSKEEFLKNNNKKLITKSRAEYLRQNRLKKASLKNSLQINSEIYEECLNYADDRIKTRNWTVKNSEIQNFVLFTINNKKVIVKDFFNYILERQSFERWNSEDSPEEIFKMFFDGFLNKTIAKIEEQEHFKNNIESLQYLEKIKEDLLISKLFSQYVIEKSLKDTAAIRAFYKQNIDLFSQKEGGTLTNSRFKNFSVYSKYKTIRDKGAPFQLHSGIRPITFQSNSYYLGTEEKRILANLLNLLKNKPGYIVEVAAHIDPSEEEYVSLSRLKAVVNYLTSNGLPLTRISEINHKAGKVLDRFDWIKNQRVSFQFFSNFESDLIKTFNERNPGDIILKVSPINKSDFEAKYGRKWEAQDGYRVIDGVPEEFSLKVTKQKPNFKDVKFEVINRYKDSLEKNLYKNIAKKYPLKLEKTEILKIIKSTIKE
jgi:peptidyl-prolyl cis-trans isomerase SurA